MMYYGFGMWILWAIVGVLILVALIVGLVWLVLMVARRTNAGVSNHSYATGGPAAAQTPKEVLQMRYARGEITREEYQTMLRDLEG